MLVITGEGLKTLDAVRGTFETNTIDALARGLQRRASREAVASDGRRREDPDAAALGGRRRAQTEVEGATCPGGAGRACSTAIGELRARIADDDGSLRRFVNVYLAGEDIRFLDGVDTAVADGAEVTILPAVAGG